MKRAEFHELHTVVVECPYCYVNIELVGSPHQWVKDDQVNCFHCGETFELGKSI